MPDEEDAETVKCAWCGHVMAVSSVMKVNVDDGGYAYLCESCAVKVDAHEVAIRAGQGPRSQSDR